jgi:hypothetical protein
MPRDKGSLMSTKGVPRHPDRGRRVDHTVERDPLDFKVLSHEIEPPEHVTLLAAASPAIVDSIRLVPSILSSVSSAGSYCRSIGAFLGLRSRCTGFSLAWSAPHVPENANVRAFVSLWRGLQM